MADLTNTGMRSTTSPRAWPQILITITRVGTQFADQAVFGTHAFRINYDVARAITEPLNEAVVNGTRYENLPKKLLKYEVTPSEEQ